VRAYERRASFQHRGPIEHWLLTVCRPECVAYARELHRERSTGQYWATFVNQATKNADDAQEDALYDQAMDLVMALPPRQRAVVLSRIVAGLSTAQVASESGCAPGTGRATLHQVMQKLRKAIRATVTTALFTSAYIPAQCLDIEPVLNPFA